MVTKRFDAPDDTALDALYADAAQQDLQPLWAQEEGLLTSTPRPSAVPFVWHWHTLLKLAARSGELVGIDRGGDRRVLALSNPGLAGRPYATATMWAGIQYLNPGEVAPAHRHTPAALRFALQGEGAWTLVNGDSVAMAPGDLVLTPSMAWHEHHNFGEQPMIWFDGLDLPLVAGLDATFCEEGPDATDTSSDSRSLSELRYGGGPGLVPAAGPREPDAHSPLLAYRWKHTTAALDDLLTTSASGHAALRFTDPRTGSDVMPTMRCEMHRVAEGACTTPLREAGSSIWVCFDGSGRITLDGVEHDIGHGDVVAVPSWTSWDLRCHTGMTLFRVSDAPVLEALALMRRLPQPD